MESKLVTDINKCSNKEVSSILFFESLQLRKQLRTQKQNIEQRY